MKKLISILSLFIIILFVLTSCDPIKNNDTERSIIFEAGFPDIIEMNVGDKLTDNYVMFKGIVDFKNDKVIFVSSDESIVRVDVSTQEFPIYTYFDIVALSPGEAIVYAQSSDGSIISTPVKITVIGNTETPLITEELPNVTEPNTENETDETDAAEEIESDIDTETETEADTYIETESEAESIALESETDAQEETIHEKETVKEDTTPAPNTEPKAEDETESKIEFETETDTCFESETESDIESEAEEIIYILNTNSKKIHRSNCRYVKQMKEENRKEFSGDIDELLSEGYTKCKTCKP